MEDLSEMLDPRAIELELHSSRKRDVIPELAGLLVRAGAIEHAGSVAEALSAREKMGSTGIGNGVAIPHCMAEGLSSPVLAFGRKKNGIAFDAMDRKPVTVFFLLVVPSGKRSLHLKLLSRLSRLLHDERFRKVLIDAADPGDILEAIRLMETE